MPFAPELRSHSQKVCTLYKKALRLIEGYYIYRPSIRYHQVILRHEFDCNRCVQDPKEQRRLLWVGEHEIFEKTNPIPPMKCKEKPYKGKNSRGKSRRHKPSKMIHNVVPWLLVARSYGLAAGVAAERVVVPPDWILDYWHPLEKAQYPEYFRKRECRKCEFIQKWNCGALC